jgi:hypothetical protein
MGVPQSWPGRILAKRKSLASHQGSEYIVAQLVEVLHYKLEGWGFNSQ